MPVEGETTKPVVNGIITHDQGVYAGENADVMNDRQENREAAYASNLKRRAMTMSQRVQRLFPKIKYTTRVYLTPRDFRLDAGMFLCLERAHESLSKVLSMKVASEIFGINNEDLNETYARVWWLFLFVWSQLWIVSGWFRAKIVEDIRIECRNSLSGNCIRLIGTMMLIWSNRIIMIKPKRR